MAKENSQTKLSKSCDPNQNIQVFVRLRPLNKEKEKRNNVEVFSDKNEVRLGERGNVQSKSCIFDGAFDEKSSQIEVYRRVVSPLIQQVLDGYNCTVFAYGQTGTGKTFTMEGERSDLECSWQEDPLSGIIPRALHHLFENICSNDVVRVSFLELYNEELYDLLGPNEDQNRLRIFEDASRKGSVIVSGLEEVAVRSKEEIYNILKRGTAKRQTAATLMNARSSRSHTIFSVTVHIKDNSIDGEDLVKIGKLNLVDLAGSENIGRSGAIDKRAREAGNINQSLLTLGRVITSLVEKAPHIPYRESKLTRLLQDSLGGRTLTSIIATISPNQADLEDTISTLEYAQRAKKITNKPEVNQKVTLRAVLRDYQDEIEKLRRDLLACREKNGFMVDENNYKEMCKKIDDMEANIKALEDEREKMTSVFLNTKETLEQKDKELMETSEDLKKKEKLLDEIKNDLNAHIKVINHQEEASSKLADQAKKLLEIADKSTIENRKLHEKIERQRLTEITNRSKLENFQTTFQKELKNLEKRIEFGSHSNQELLNKIEKSAVDNIQNIKDQNECLNIEVIKLMDTNTDQDETTNKVIESFENLNKLKEIKKDYDCEVKEALKETHDSLIQNFEQFNKQFDESFKIFVEAMLDKIKFTQENLDKQKEAFRHSIISRDRLIMQTRERFTHIINYQKGEIQRRIDENNELKNLINKNVNDNVDKIKKLSENLENLKESQVEFKNRFDGVVNEKIVNINENLTTLETNQKDLICYFDNTSSNMNKEDKESLETYDLLEKLVFNSLPCEIYDFKSTLDTFRNSTDENLIGCVKSYQKNTNNLNNLNENSSKLIEETEEFCKNNAEILNKKMIDKNEGFNKLRENLSVYSEMVNLTKEEIEKEIKNAIVFNIQMKNTYESELSLKEKHLAGLKRDLVKCDPTGNTPQKSIFEYSKDIKTVSPYQKILKRFLVSNENIPNQQS